MAKIHDQMELLRKSSNKLYEAKLLLDNLADLEASAEVDAAADLLQKANASLRSMLQKLADICEADSAARGNS
jgi:hypothetical protein